jgi:hypothetical protein
MEPASLTRAQAGTASGMTAAILARSVALFVIAGLMEIGGGYLVWLWLREGRAFVLGALGGLEDAAASFTLSYRRCGRPARLCVPSFGR